MFPQLIAGPVVRYSDIARELDCRTENLNGFASGARKLICGLAKKVLIANRMVLETSRLYLSKQEPPWFDCPGRAETS